jgi:hypothetical protein
MPYQGDALRSAFGPIDFTPIELLPFPARVLAAIQDAAGYWRYSFAEQSWDVGTGGWVDAIPGRFGDISTGISMAFEANNEHVTPPFFVNQMRPRGMVAGQMVFDFSAPPSAGGTITGPVIFTGTVEHTGTSTITYDVGSVSTYSSGSVIVYAGPTVNYTASATTTLDPSATLTYRVSTGGGSPSYTTLYATVTNGGGTTATTTYYPAQTIALAGSPVNVTDNTTVTLAAGKILTWAGGAGSSWVFTIPTVDLTGVTTLSLPASATVGGSPISALASGSGLSDVLTGSPARWYAAGLRGGYSPASSSLTSGTLYAMPLRGYGGRTIDKIKLSVSTAGASGKHARMGIYATTSAGTPYPAALVADGGAFLADSTGDKVTTLGSAVVLSTQTVWLVVLAEDNVIIKGMSASGLDCELGLLDDWTTLSGSNPGGVGWSAAQAYGVMPSTFPSSAGSATLLDGTALPLLGAHFSA